MRKKILLLLPAAAAFWLASRLLVQDAGKPSLEEAVEDSGGRMADGRTEFNAHPLFVEEAVKPSLEQTTEDLRRQMEDGRKKFEAQMKEMQKKLDDLAKSAAPGAAEPKSAPQADAENVRREMDELPENI